MDMDSNKSVPASDELRCKAEELLNAKAKETQLPQSEHEIQRLLHELQVHQIELEMQNAELRQTRDELDTLLGKYTDLYDLAPSGYFTLDREGTILAANLSGADLLEVARSRLIGRRFVQFVADEGRQSFLDFLGKVFASWDKESFETPLLTKSGRLLIVHIEMIAGASGQEAFAAVSDVTEQRVAEQEVRKLNKELENRVIERTAELERINKELEGFCHAISHEFRAPLARLEGFSTLMLETAGENDYESMTLCARRIIVASNRLKTVIGSLLELNELSRAGIHLQPLNLSGMAEQIVSEHLETAAPDSLRVSIAPGLTATCDQSMLEICLRNLLGNAIKYSSKKPDALVEFGQIIDGGKPVFFIRDNGVGFDMEHAKNIFQPFYRMHHESDFEGTGVGLATVYRIIEKHDGQIWAEAKPGEGATFYFTLP